MIRHPLVLALALALLPAVASAEDLLQTYELARTGDPVLSAAEANRLAVREGSVQARAALLPQINGQATLTRTRDHGRSVQTAFDENRNIVSFPASSDSETTTRRVGVSADQVLFDFGRFSTLRSQDPAMSTETKKTVADRIAELRAKRERLRAAIAAVDAKIAKLERAEQDRQIRELARLVRSGKIDPAAVRALAAKADTPQE